MATPLTTNAFKTTYKDDFADSSGYHKILFNAGKALQARELTQLQTILQNQIQRFGDNIFKEGAVVKPGGANVNPKYEFIKLDTSTNTLPADTESLVGTTFTGTTSSIQAKVLQVLIAASGDPDTLYVQYTNTSSASNFTNVIRMNAGEDMSNGSITLTVQATNTAVNPATGVGTLATLAEGIYYTRGHFVFTKDQSKVISRYTDNSNANLGFIVAEDVITATDDNSLYDNQGAAANLTAPGADRYRITLNIAVESEVDSDQNFIHVATFGAAIGLKGEIKVNLLTSTIDVFRSLDQYYNFDQSIKWSFDSVVMRQEKCVALPSHCKNRDDAEELKNQKIFSFKENFPSVNPNEYLVSDLIGCDIIHKNGNSLGNVISVDNFGAGDLLETIYKNKKIYIPLDDNVLSVDLEKKIILVDPIKGIIDND